MSDFPADFFALLAIAAAAYLLPGIVASLRGHHQAAAIWVLTVLLGWSGLGWAAAMVWAFTAVRRHSPAPAPATHRAGPGSGQAPAS